VFILWFSSFLFLQFETLFFSIFFFFYLYLYFLFFFLLYSFSPLLTVRSSTMRGFWAFAINVLVDFFLLGGSNIPGSVARTS